MSGRRDAFGLRPLAFGIVTALGALGSPALAQPQAPVPQGASPIVVQKINDRFIVAPEYKLTDLDGRTGQLVGGTAGYLMQDLLLIGGSVYHLVGGASGWDLTYGGLVVGVQMPTERRISFGARGLVGMGSASHATTLSAMYPDGRWMMQSFQDAMFGNRHWHLPGYAGFGPGTDLAVFPDMRVRVDDQFFVFEPQANVLFAITNRIRFGVSGGYRVTGNNDVFRNALNGATGAITLQVGLGR